MLIYGFVVFVEFVKAFGQVCSQCRGIVPLQRRVVKVELVFIVVGKACEFLETRWLDRKHGQIHRQGGKGRGIECCP